MRRRPSRRDLIKGNDVRGLCSGLGCIWLTSMWEVVMVMTEGLRLRSFLEKKAVGNAFWF